MILLNKTVKYLSSVCKNYLQSNAKKFITHGQTRFMSVREEVQPPSVRFFKNRAKNTPVQPLAYTLLAIPVVSFGLGTWQILRKQEKEEKIRRLKEKTNLPVVNIPKDLNELKDMEYHPVRVKGKFDHSREIYMGPRSRIKDGKSYSQNQGLLSTSTAGFLVITPFTLSDSGLTILVNRGWVPAAEKSPSTRPQGQITGEVELVGYVRQSEGRQTFGMKNLPEQGFWIYRDLEKLAEHVGTLPVMIDADAASTVPGGPIGGQTVVGLRNEHLSYIFTWYALSGFTGYMWYKYYIRKVFI